MKLPAAVKEMFKKAGSKGGEVAAKNLTKVQRKDRARKGALAMHAKHKKK